MNTSLHYNPEKMLYITIYVRNVIKYNNKSAFEFEKPMSLLLETDLNFSLFRIIDE